MSKQKRALSKERKAEREFKELMTTLYGKLEKDDKKNDQKS